jgi:hypothetical protein
MQSRVANDVLSFCLIPCRLGELCSPGIGYGSLSRYVLSELYDYTGRFVPEAHGAGARDKPHLSSIVNYAQLAFTGNSDEFLH